MARTLRLEYPGAIYHVTCRMVGDWQSEKTLLFRDDADRERFLDRLAERVGQYHIRLYLFVCMTNHFHLVFETPESNCSKFMQSLSTAYTVYYNLRHGRHGHLLDGRFKAKLVDGDEYLLALSRYVHLNPVQVGVMKSRPMEERLEALRAWRWSSYPDYVGKRKDFGFVEYGPVLSEMSGKRREWPKRYREYVESGLAGTDSEFIAALKKSPHSIGGDGFRAWIDEHYRKRVESHARPEDVSFRHAGESLSTDETLNILAEVFDVEASEFKRRRHDSPLRAVAARMLIRYAARNQREVAALLGIGSGSGVCKHLTGLPAWLIRDRRLRHRVEQAEKRMLGIQAVRGRRATDVRV